MSLFPGGLELDLSGIPDRLHLGTSSFSSADWVGSFYPSGCRPAEFLAEYETVQLEVELTDEELSRYNEARALYTDLDPPPERRRDDATPTPPAVRARGAGRPTKRERRDLDRLRDHGDPE